MGKSMAIDDIRQRLGLRPIINVSGTMTALGASIVVPEAVEAVAAILPASARVRRDISSCGAGPFTGGRA